MTPGPVPDALMRSLFDDAPCGYLVTTDEGTITSVNATFVRWSGHPLERLVGTRLQALLPIGDQILFATHCIPQLGIHAAIGEVAIDVVAADGTRKAALLSATRVPPTDSDPAHLRVIIFSAHERRLYENDLLAARRRAEESEASRAVAEADLRHRVLHDALTGLPNRQGLVEHLAGALHGGGPAAQVRLFFIDLDHFKSVNDSLGHAAGDQLLSVVAGRLRATVPPGAVIARLAGDEFVVADVLDVIEGDEREDGDIAELAPRLLDVVNSPVVIDGLEVLPSASVGVVRAPAAGADVEQLLRHADTAMYRAKALGRGRWEQHDPTAPDATADRLRLLEELRHGVERGELRLHYQPRVNLVTGAVRGVEALVRWEHPRRGLLGPAAFIDAAEESGLIRGVGAWVLDEALRQARTWVAAEVGELEMAVNLSARQLTDAGLVPLVARALAAHEIAPAQLTLEITETAVMVDPDAALATLAQLHELGVKLAVDDFGTGYSSLTYLKRLPVDELKIDQSFVRGLGSDRGDTAIVTSCIQLAHAMGVHAVAEGVETDRHRVHLTRLGCDVAQGYLYSRPLPADELRTWVTARGTVSTADPAA